MESSTGLFFALSLWYNQGNTGFLGEERYTCNTGGATPAWGGTQTTSFRSVPVC